jgi:hypothetical protein
MPPVQSKKMVGPEAAIGSKPPPTFDLHTPSRYQPALDVDLDLDLDLALYLSPNRRASLCKLLESTPSKRAALAQLPPQCSSA